MAKRSNIKEFVKTAKEIHGEYYDYSESHYINRDTKLTIICPKHGKFYQSPKAHIGSYKQGCPKCGKDKYIKSNSSNTKDFIKKAKKIHGNFYDYSKTNYINSKRNVTITCREHGEFQQRPNSHLMGSNCPVCARQKIASSCVYDKTKFAEISAKQHNNYYDYSAVKYNNKDEKVTIICPKHGKFKQHAGSHMRGHGCPKCVNHESKQDKAISQFLTEIGITNNTSVMLKDILPNESSKLELDVYAAELKIGIEHHGLISHADGRNSDRQKHRNKWQICYNNGIKLIQIFSDEWRDKQDLIKRKLAAMTGNCQKYAARKCLLQPVSSKTAGQFYRENHMQGHASDMKISYGLFYEGVLVAVASFSNKNMWKVERYATTGRVQGGFSKIFKQFIKDHNPDSVLSYADLRWGNGDVFGHAGFKDCGVTVPDYWWTDFRNRISRYKVQKRPAGISEREYCESMGLKKIYGVGHRRWIWKKNDPAEAGSVLIKPLKV